MNISDVKKKEWNDFFYDGNPYYLEKTTHGHCKKWCCVLHQTPIKLIRQTSKCYGIGVGCFYCGREVETKVTYTDYYHTIN